MIISDFYNNLDPKYFNYFLEIPHKVHEIKTKNNESIFFHEYEHKVFYSTRKFYIIENKTNKNLVEFDFEDLLFTDDQKDLSKNLKMIFHFNYVKKKEIKFENLMSNDDLDVFVKILQKFNADKGLELSNELSDFLLLNDREISKDNLIKQPNRLLQYLLLNNVIKKEYEITINIDSSEKEIDDWFIKIEKKKQKEKIDGYCDLDYYPFVFKNYLVIDCVSTDKIYYCEFKNKNNFIWYSTEERLFEDENNQNDVYYESNVYISKLINQSKNDKGKILVVENGEIKFITKEVSSLNLVQNLIIKKLEDDNKIERIIPVLSFEQLLNNYTTQKTMWNIQERAFFELLEDLDYIDGKLTYNEFEFINENDYIIKHEKEEYFTNESIFSKLETLSMNVNLELHHRIEILKYIENVLEIKYPNAKLGLSKVKEGLSLNINPKMRM